MRHPARMILPCLLTLALPMLGTSAWANASVDMNTGTFQFTITDLTPGDGVDAGFSIDSQASLTRIIAGVSNVNRVELTAPGLFTPLMHADHFFTTSYTSEISATGMHVRLAETVPMGRDIGVSAEAIGHVTLQPHTRLDIALPYSWVGDAAPVSIDQAFFLWANIFTPQLMDDQQETMLGGHYERSGLLHGLLINDTDQVQNAGFEARILAVAPVVPEPSTWGLMVLGLGVLGVRVRRWAGNRAGGIH